MHLTKKADISLHGSPPNTVGTEIKPNSLQKMKFNHNDDYKKGAKLKL
jgi:hypothetical protein